MTKIISVMNYKGGVGKTTLTSNISAELAYRGYKVLMIDLDPQSSLTFSFVTPDDWKSHLSEEKTIKNWLTFEEGKAECFKDLIFAPKRANEEIKKNSDGLLNMIASHLDLINIDLELAAELKGSTIKQQRNSYLKVHNSLKSGTESLSDVYDYIIIDCPPNFNIVTKNAIVASDYVIVPAKPDYLSTLGIIYLQRNLNELIRDYNYFCEGTSDNSTGQDSINPVIAGVVFTMVQLYDAAPISVQRQYIQEVKHSNVPVFKAYMRENKSIFAEAPQYLLPVVLEKRGSRKDIVIELEQIVDELIAKTNER
jgi:chromosome partitioning protein